MGNVAGSLQNPGLTVSSLSYTRCSWRGKEGKSSEGRSTFLFAGAFCLLALLFGILQARAAIENQMNSQLLPSNSISGGKQKPATVTGRKRGRGRHGFGRKLFLFLLSLGKVPGETGLHPWGTWRRSLTSVHPGGTGMRPLPWSWLLFLLPDVSHLRSAFSSRQSLRIFFTGVSNLVSSSHS